MLVLECLIFHIIFSTGLPRTGTSSTRAALAILLDGACYHMVNVFGGTKEDWNHWDRALDEINKKEKTITDEVNFICDVTFENNHLSQCTLKTVLAAF